MYEPLPHIPTKAGRIWQINRCQRLSRPGEIEPETQQAGDTDFNLPFCTRWFVNLVDADVAAPVEPNRSHGALVADKKRGI
jgi:hypothetical protein